MFAYSIIQQVLWPAVQGHQEPGHLAEAEQKSAQPGHHERDAPPVQVSRQILSGGRERRDHSGHHAQDVLPAGEGGHPARGDLLSAGDVCLARQLCHAGQVWRP
jgi:hypothetical protein